MTLDVLVEERGQSVWIWINREERRNALNETVLESIRSAILEAESKPIFGRSCSAVRAKKHFAPAPT